MSTQTLKERRIVIAQRSARLADRIMKTAKRIRDAHARVRDFDRARKTKAAIDQAFEASKNIQPEV